MPELDRIDRKILDALQRQGRIPMTELASQVGLSASPCTERVRRLEREKVITGYHAHLSPEALGKSLLVFVESRQATQIAAASVMRVSPCFSAGTFPIGLIAR